MADYAHPEVLVSTDWVLENKDKDGIKIVESNEDILLYEVGHIEGAIKLDWETELQDSLIRDYVNQENFEALMSSKGISQDDTVVFYGDKSNWWACYALWTFKIYGHENCLIMNGGRQKWLDENKHATMYWMSKRKEERKNIYKYFPEVKSIISLGYNYYTGENDLNSNDYKISNYSWGEDYHLVIKKKLYEIIEYIESKLDLKFKYRVCVDTSPLLEKRLAQRAGLGWGGKHTNLINDEIGSWFFLSEILLYNLYYFRNF